LTEHLKISGLFKKEKGLYLRIFFIIKGRGPFKPGIIVPPKAQTAGRVPQAPFFFFTKGRPA